MASMHHGLCYFWDGVCQKFCVSVFVARNVLNGLLPWLLFLLMSHWNHPKFASIFLDDVFILF